MENLKIYNNLKRPPATSLKQITAGRLKGKSDINPQWRVEAMTSEFGPCGIGWRYEIVDKWTINGLEGQIFAFVNINLYVKVDEVWSFGIPGTGGSMLIAKEKEGPHHNDEAFKMATTDALSVAMKALGMAADIYMGLWDGSKYKTYEPVTKTPTPQKTVPEIKKLAAIEQTSEIRSLLANSTVEQKIIDRTNQLLNEGMTVGDYAKSFVYLSKHQY